ncbi:MAG: hypothetical protein WCW47_03830 [Candidatus Paceibacterota bacterium]
MKILRVSVVVIVLSFLGYFLYSIPQFYFNNLEYRTSELFTEIEDVNKLASDHIEQRSGREGGSKTPDEIKKLSLTIQDDLDRLEGKIKEHEDISAKQNKITFLLNSKYINYLKLKNLAFEKYYLSLRKFKTLKEFEGTTHEVLLARDNAKNTVLEAISQKPPNFENSDTLVQHLNEIKQKLSNYKKGDYLTDKYYQVLISDLDANIERVTTFKRAILNNYTYNQLDSELAKNSHRYDDNIFSIALSESVSTKMGIKRQEWTNLYSEFDEKSVLAAEYYKVNKLYNDPISLTLSVFNKKYPKNLFRSLLSDFFYEDKFADLNGDGVPEKLRLILPSNPSTYESPLMIAYDSNNQEIARLPYSIPINTPRNNSGRVHTLSTESKRQAVSFDFSAGMHEIQTMFFELIKSDQGAIIIPICLKKEAVQASDCLFWTSEPGYLIADDFNDDGTLDVAEIVNEYPKDGEISKEIENSIMSAGDNKELNKLLLRISKREAGGKGNPVVWNTYSYNGEYFQNYSPNEYQNIFQGFKAHVLARPEFSNIKKRTDISKESENYNIFVKTIWTQENNRDDDYLPSSPLS